MSEAQAQITLLLRRLRDGDATAAGSMMSLLYDELRGIAGRLLRPGRAHTLQPTALVHEAWLKIRGGDGEYADRVHFLAVAATAMRQVLLNHARDRAAQKRGGDRERLPLDECLDLIAAEAGDVVALDDVLDQLAAAAPRPAKVVEMRVFAGMTVEEVAAALDTTPALVKADWRFARAFLQRKLQSDGPQPAVD
ncbi:MAG: ECF-type sigma factor [Planctomycetota bacterium]